MKKLLIINTKYKIFGGEDSNIFDEIKLLKKYYEVQYVNYDNAVKISFSDLLAFFTNNNIASNHKLKKYINDFDPEIIYVHNTWFKANLGIYRILNKKNDIVILNKIHNLRYDCSRHLQAKNHFKEHINCPACANTGGSKKLINKYYEESWLKSLFLGHFSRKYFKILKNFRLKILVLNNFHKNYLNNLGVDAGKIYSFHNPIGELNYSHNSDSDYVIYAGRINNSKGIPELIKAWDDANIEGLKLKIIGDGDLYHELKKNKNPDILFLGELDNSKTKEFIKSARAVITTTKMYEGQPRLLSEAASFGIPSIYPSFGGMDEYFPEGYPLKFRQFDYKDLVNKIKLLENKSLLAIEGKNIFNYTINKFNEENTIQIFNKIIMDNK